MKSHLRSLMFVFSSLASLVGMAQQATAQMPPMPPMDADYANAVAAKTMATNLYNQAHQAATAVTPLNKSLWWNIIFQIAVMPNITQEMKDLSIDIGDDCDMERIDFVNALTAANTDIASGDVLFGAGAVAFANNQYGVAITKFNGASAKYASALGWFMQAEAWRQSILERVQILNSIKNGTFPPMMP